MTNWQVRNSEAPVNIVNCIRKFDSIQSQPNSNPVNGISDCDTNPSIGLVYGVPVNATVLTERDSSTVVVHPQNIPQFALAQVVIQNKAVIHIREIECFIIKDSKDTHHAIKLFSKQTCQCPPTNQCYHIVVVSVTKKSLSTYVFNRVKVKTNNKSKN